MCGICGQFNFNGASVNPDVIEAMTSELSHRGPDEHSTFVEGHVGLGHRRLTIIDLTSTGAQPMRSADGKKWVVFNGEIYNYRELKRELESLGKFFCSTSDTEVLLGSYEQWGMACLERLRGMFAFAIWDGTQRAFFLARDRIGIKPLYYCLTDKVLLFASEIKAILQSPDVARRVNPRGLIDYFTFGHSVAPGTIYSGINKLLPGHYLVCSGKGNRIAKYWDVDRVPVEEAIDERESVAQVRRLLTDAVRSHLVSDVPVGAFLSGGIDSSAIVAFMSEVMPEPVQTFSVGFDVGGYYNELDDARIVARQFQTDHHEKIVQQVDVESLIQTLVYHYDEPFADAANLPTLIISQFARQHVKVVLSGEGGDEIFGGYRRYGAERFSRYLRPIAAFLQKEGLSKWIPSSTRWRRVRKAIETMSVEEPDVRYGTWLALLNDDAREELFRGVIHSLLEQYDGYWPYRDYYNRPLGWDTVNRMLYTDLKTWLPDTYLEKIDKATMAVGLEGRVPFLDHHLVEYAISLPGHLKVKRWTTKYILKQALIGVLPHKILYKPKHGFAVPLDEWFRGKLKTFLVDVLFDERAKQHEYLNSAAIEKLFQQHVSGQADCGIQLWSLLNFELWHRRFMER